MTDLLTLFMGTVACLVGAKECIDRAFWGLPWLGSLCFAVGGFLLAVWSVVS